MSKRALVVDDVEFNRMLLADMLEREGWETAEAVDGEDALVKLEGDHGFDLVVLDIRMPGKSGEDVCRILRSDPQYSSLPLIAYTAHALEEERDSFYAIGFDAVLIKPINMTELTSALDQAFSKYTETIKI